MASDNPKVSVLMSVYNAENDLGKSVDSILNQSFTDFEFIIINDGSKDGTREMLDAYAAKDLRIVVVHQDNTGLTKALNKGAALAKGEYIARQDGDDTSYPDRLRRQVELMEADKRVVLVGGNCDDVYPDGYKAQWGYYSSEELQKIVYLKTPFPHSTAMMRTSVCKELGGYDESYKTAQDIEFWMRFAKKGKLAMIVEPVIERGVVAGSISQKRRWRQFYDSCRARWTHNRGFGRARALYIAVRSLVIGLLPPSIIKLLKG